MADSMVPKDDETDAHIISGVIEGVKQSFIDSGVDLDVLKKLEELWASKLSLRGSQGIAVADVVIPRPVPDGNELDAVALQERAENDPALLGPGSSVVAPIAKSAVPKRHKRKHIIQLDGPADSSDEEDPVDDDDDGDDDDDDDDDDIDPDADDDDEGVEEEPLGSEDDISDEDASDLFETDNVVVCQYDKITRARNKWKFHLKDGIMNLNGKDYVFQRAHGDAEW